MTPAIQFLHAQTDARVESLTDKNDPCPTAAVTKMLHAATLQQTILHSLSNSKHLFHKYTPEARFCMLRQGIHDKTVSL